MDNKETIDKERQTLARLAAIEAIRERALTAELSLKE